MARLIPASRPQKQPSRHAGCQEVSRCHTRGESDESIAHWWQSMRVRGFTLTLKPRADAWEVQTDSSMAIQKGLMSSNYDSGQKREYLWFLLVQKLQEFNPLLIECCSTTNTSQWQIQWEVVPQVREILDLPLPRYSSLKWSSEQSVYFYRPQTKFGPR